MRGLINASWNIQTQTGRHNQDDPNSDSRTLRKTVLMDQMKCKFSSDYFYLVLSMHEAAWGRKKLEQATFPVISSVPERGHMWASSELPIVFLTFLFQKSTAALDGKNGLLDLTTHLALEPTITSFGEHRQSRENPLLRTNTREALKKIFDWLPFDKLQTSPFFASWWQSHAQLAARVRGQKPAIRAPFAVAKLPSRVDI